jgi:hypothetical protein
LAPVWSMTWGNRASDSGLRGLSSKLAIRVNVLAPADGVDCEEVS